MWTCASNYFDATKFEVNTCIKGQVCVKRACVWAIRALRTHFKITVYGGDMRAHISAILEQNI